MTKIVNDTLLSALDTFYVRQNSPTYALGAAESIFKNALGLHCLWIVGASNQTQLTDQSGNARNLSRNGGAFMAATGLITYYDLSGAGQWLFRADEATLDAPGNDAWIVAARQGVTVGAWFYMERGTAREGLITKGDGTVANTNFALEHRGDLANDPVEFSVSNGVAMVTVSQPSVSLNQWHFIVGRFTNGGTVDVFVDLTKTIGAAGPATPLVNNVLQFQVGAQNGIDPFDGRVKYIFLCTAALTDAYIYTMYHYSRAIFGR